MGKRRVQIDISEDDFEILNQLRETSYHSTISSVFNDAFKVYHWIRDEEAHGQVLLSVPKGSEMHRSIGVRELVPLFTGNPNKNRISEE